MTERLRRAARRPSSLAALVVLLFLSYGLWIGYQWQRNRLYDFNVYYIAAFGFRQGIDVYALARDYASANAPQWVALAEAAHVEYYAPPYRYPPLTAQLVLPLTLLDARTAGLIWLTLTALAFMLSAWLMAGLASTPEGPALAFALMLIFVPALTTLHAGQVNGFVLLALAISMWGIAQRPRRGGGRRHRPSPRCSSSCRSYCCFISFGASSGVRDRLRLSLS